MSHVEKALELYGSNFNCAQAVFGAFAGDLGLDEKTALKIGTNLGSGARSGEMCGAVSGALMVLGLKYGHCESADTDSKLHSYEKAEEFLAKFKEVNGTIICRELLGYDLTKPEDMEVIAEKNLFRTFCPDMVESAVKVLEGII